MSSMPKHDPELVLVEVGGELLAFDRRSGKTHCLAPLAAKVFQACDGSDEESALAALVKESPELNAELVQGICAELAVRGLVQLEGTSKISRLPRRAFLSSAAAAALFMTAAMPSPAAASSQCVTSCIPTANTGKQCRANCANPPAVPPTFCYRCYSLTGFLPDGVTPITAGQDCVFQFNTAQCLTDSGAGTDAQPDCAQSYINRNNPATDDAWCCINTGAQTFANAAGGQRLLLPMARVAAFKRFRI